MLIVTGNDFRSDDAAGLYTGHLLKKLLPSARIVFLTSEASNLIYLWENAEEVVLIDATSSGSAPGTLHYFAADQNPLPAVCFRFSTHSFDLAQAVEMSRQLGTLPKTVHVYGIEGANFCTGQKLTAEVEQTCHTLANRLAGVYGHPRS